MTDALSDPATEPAEGIAATPGPLAKTVHQALRGSILSGRFALNEKLPGEHELAAQFSVSRPIIRDALRLLREEGLVRSRRGAGSFVAASKSAAEHRPSPSFAPIETVADIQRCYDFRLTLEPDQAYWAALRWNAAALADIRAALDLMRDATIAHLHREDADFAFHSAIARATNNHYYESTLGALKDNIFVGMKFHGYSAIRADRGLETVLAEHRAILDAICARDPDRARDLMRRHLEASRDRVFEGRLLDLKL
jgi:GntR family transcriptional regulator, transcriptional repressor for pyruvate dehydrogenase complex